LIYENQSNEYKEAYCKPIDNYINFKIESISSHKINSFTSLFVSTLQYNGDLYKNNSVVNEAIQEINLQRKKLYQIEASNPYNKFLKLKEIDVPEIIKYKKLFRFNGVSYYVIHDDINIDEINEISLKMDIHNKNRKKLAYEKWENIINNTFYNKIFTRYNIIEFDGNNKKKVISYSLWGNNLTYNIGAIKNALMALEFYPDFECWFYIHKESVLNETINSLEKMNNVKIIFKSGDLKKCKPMMWRFEAIDDDNVELIISRDADSRFTLREKLAVNEWLKSDKTFHIMRDHPHHNFVILGGMFGSRKIKGLDKWSNIINNYIQDSDKMYDQDFLRDSIYPLIKNDAIIHATFHKYENELCKDFPIGYDDSYRFIGEYIYADESRSLQHIEALKNAI
jgi:hypothetical protein